MNENENVILKSEENNLMKVVLLMPSDTRLNFNIIPEYELNMEIKTMSLSNEFENEIFKTNEMGIEHGFLIYQTNIREYVEKLVDLLSKNEENKSYCTEAKDKPFYALCADILPQFIQALVEKELSLIPREERNLVLFNGVYDESGMIAISTISDDFKNVFIRYGN